MKLWVVTLEGHDYSILKGVATDHEEFIKLLEYAEGEWERSNLKQHENVEVQIIEANHPMNVDQNVND